MKNNKLANPPGDVSLSHLPPDAAGAGGSGSFYDAPVKKAPLPTSPINFHAANPAGMARDFLGFILSEVVLGTVSTALFFIPFIGHFLYGIVTTTQFLLVPVLIIVGGIKSHRYGSQIHGWYWHWLMHLPRRIFKRGE